MSKPPYSHVITLNVGGYMYTTTEHTLTKYPGSMLCSMFDGSRKPCFLRDGTTFIDRNGQLFENILDFLRSGKLSLPDDFKNTERLLMEAEFYEIAPMVAELKPLCYKNAYVIDVTYRLVQYNLCNIIISGTASAMEKLPSEYLDAETRLKITARDNSVCRISLTVSPAYVNRKDFNKVLNDNKWERKVRSVPCFTDDSMPPLVTNHGEECEPYRDVWYHK